MDTNMDEFENDSSASRGPGSYNKASGIVLNDNAKMHIGNHYHYHGTDEPDEETILSNLCTSSTLYIEMKNRNDRRGKGTCGWFLNHDLYSRWQKHPFSSILLVSADPGCGKSVLARHVIDEELPKKTKPERTDLDRTGPSIRTTCYFFFKEDGQRQSTAREALQCILYQLLCSRRELITKEVTRQLTQPDDRVYNSVGFLWNLLVTIARNPDAGEVICVLDGLDECDEADCKKLMDLVAQFYESPSSGQMKLKILCTSRPYKYISDPLEMSDSSPDRVYHIRGHSEAIANQISSEIDAYIKYKVDSVTGLDSQDRLLLARNLTKVENRTYLWVYLVIEMICQESYPGRLVIESNTSISQLPRSVNEAYEQILIRSKNKDETEKVLQIVLAATEPLTLREMASAMATREDIDKYENLYVREEENFAGYIRELCGFFVRVVDDKVYLLHQTASEFLLRKPGRRFPQNPFQRWEGSLVLAQCHVLLAKTCMRYLYLCRAPYIKDHYKVRGFCQGTLLVKTFFHYSADKWYFHAREASMPADDLMLRLCGGLGEEWLPKMWMRTVLPHTGGLVLSKSGRLPPLCVASFCGLEVVAQEILQRDPSALGIEDEHQQSALMYCVLFGFKNVVDLLLRYATLAPCPRWPHTTLVDRMNRSGTTSLYCSIKEGHHEIAIALLEAGANPNVGHSCVACAAERGDIVMVKALLGYKANHQARNRAGDTPLHFAAWSKSTECVLELVAAGADTNALNNAGRSPLHDAAQRGGVEAAEFLMQHGAAPSLRDAKGESPLHIAILADQLCIVTLLLRHGVDPNIRDNQEDTPLHTAARRCGPLKLRIVRSLLAKGARVNVRNKLGDTPLHRWVSWAEDGEMFLAVIELLLKNGADPYAVNMKMATPLDCAFLPSVERLLSNHLADLNTVDVLRPAFEEERQRHPGRGK